MRDGVVLYVGSSTDIERRLRGHVGALQGGWHMNSHLQRSFSKYGGAGFEFSIVEVCDRESLIEREQYWIDTLVPTCNVALAAGHPTRGRHLSEDHKRQLSDARKGRPMTEEAKRKLSEYRKGRKMAPLTEEHKQKLRDAWKRRRAK